MMPANPFSHTSVATDKSFCGRAQEIKKLIGLINDGQNILIYSKRRIGKTSLIKEVFKSYLDDKYIAIYVDIYGINSESDLTKKLYTAVAKSLPFSLKDTLGKLKSLFSRTTFGATINDSGEVEYKPMVSGRDYDEQLDEIFSAIESFSKNNNKKVVVAIDEFQEIANLEDKKIDAKIREKIQNQPNISYIFSGSKRHLLLSLFSDYKKPLYEMVNYIQLEPIDADEFYAFFNEKIQIERDVFGYLYSLTDGESKFIQHIGYLLFAQGTKDAKKEDVDRAIKDIVASKEPAFKIYYDSITRNQKIALKVVAKTGGKGVFNKEICFEEGITPQAMLSSLSKLLKDEVLEKEGERYIYLEKSFEMWVADLG